MEKSRNLSEVHFPQQCQNKTQSISLKPTSYPKMKKGDDLTVCPLLVDWGLSLFPSLQSQCHTLISWTPGLSLGLPAWSLPPACPPGSSAGSYSHHAGGCPVIWQDVSRWPSLPLPERTVVRNLTGGSPPIMENLGFLDEGFPQHKGTGEWLSPVLWLPVLKSPKASRDPFPFSHHREVAYLFGNGAPPKGAFLFCLTATLNEKGKELVESQFQGWWPSPRGRALSLYVKSRLT